MPCMTLGGFIKSSSPICIFVSFSISDCGGDGSDGGVKDCVLEVEREN